MATLDVNQVSEIPSSYMPSEQKVRNRPLRARNSRDPTPKDHGKKPTKSTGTGSGSFLNTSKSRSYFQPTLDYLQKGSRAAKIPAPVEPEEPVQEVEEDVDMTFCSALEPLPRRRDRSLDLQDTPSDLDFGEFFPANPNEKASPEKPPIKRERSSSPAPAPAQNPYSANLFDTEDLRQGDSVLLLDSENPNEPISIQDTVQDSDGVMNMERLILQYNPSPTDRQFTELSYFGNREDLSQFPDPDPEPIRVPKINCKDCSAYYKYLRKTCSSQEALSRLKCFHKKVRPETPEGFWNVGFTPTEQENL